ncbi:hypothetical protein [Paraburkholderia mimosarum]|uniref:hypothetical protein n=1 Tax=Paraburkholderia mimosarum TaxID=312026 RepID=UPI0012B5B9D0|nr:hypothetical protein [Paraburkholderia mimosarum]
MNLDVLARASPAVYGKRILPREHEYFCSERWQPAVRIHLIHHSISRVGSEIHDELVVINPPETAVSPGNKIR